MIYNYNKFDSRDEATEYLTNKNIIRTKNVSMLTSYNTHREEFVRPGCTPYTKYIRDGNITEIEYMANGSILAPLSFNTDYHICIKALKLAEEANKIDALLWYGAKSGKTPTDREYVRLWEERSYMLAIQQTIFELRYSNIFENLDTLAVGATSLVIDYDRVNYIYTYANRYRCSQCKYMKLPCGARVSLQYSTEISVYILQACLWIRNSKSKTKILKKSFDHH